MSANRAPASRLAPESSPSSARSAGGSEPPPKTPAARTPSALPSAPLSDEPSERDAARPAPVSPLAAPGAPFSTGRLALSPLTGYAVADAVQGHGADPDPSPAPEPPPSRPQDSAFRPGCRLRLRHRRVVRATRLLLRPRHRRAARATPRPEPREREDPRGHRAQDPEGHRDGQDPGGHRVEDPAVRPQEMRPPPRDPPQPSEPPTAA